MVFVSCVLLQHWLEFTKSVVKQLRCKYPLGRLKLHPYGGWDETSLSMKSWSTHVMLHYSNLALSLGGFYSGDWGAWLPQSPLMSVTFSLQHSLHSPCAFV